MKKQISIYIALFVFISSIAFAGAPINEINALIDAHGKKNVANFIKEKSDNGSVTVEIDGQLVVKLGKPAAEYITPKSIQSDFTRLGITIEQAKAEIVGTNDDKVVKKYVVNNAHIPDPNNPTYAELAASGANRTEAEWNKIYTEARAKANSTVPMIPGESEADHQGRANRNIDTAELLKLGHLYEKAHSINSTTALMNKCAQEDADKNKAIEDARYEQRKNAAWSNPSPPVSLPPQNSPTMMNNPTAVPAPDPAISQPREVHVNPDMPFFPNH